MPDPSLSPQRPGPIYELAPQPVAPALPGTVVLRDCVDSLVEAIAADLMIHAQNCVRTFGDFHIALSGGSTPLPLYHCLMTDPRYRAMPWHATHLWIVDERRVPFDDDKSNFKSINEMLGDHSGIPPDQVHPMFALAEDADTAYESLLREVLGWREKGQDRLDYALLGMGADGHTASLFPRSPALHAPEPRLAIINAGPNVVPPDRVTMTFRMLNASRFLAVMVAGQSKRETIRRVSLGSRGLSADTEETLPILGIKPLAGELRWYLDHEACTTP